CLQAAISVELHGEIYRWNAFEPIPGTAGIWPDPGVELVLEHMDLSFAELQNRDLTNASFEFSDLSYARMDHSILKNVRLTGATVVGAWLSSDTSGGFTEEQLKSTASYQSRNLAEIKLDHNDLTGWDFSGQNLSYASVKNSALGAASFAFAQAPNVNMLGADLKQADLRGADLTNAHLSYASITSASFGNANLTRASLIGSDLTNTDFRGANLTLAKLEDANLASANLTGATVVGASFRGAASKGFTLAQLASTVSYQSHRLVGIDLARSDLSGWDLSEQDLRRAGLWEANLRNTNLRSARLSDSAFFASVLNHTDFSNADLTNATFDLSEMTDVDLSNAVIVGASFYDTTSRGLTLPLLASTSSFQSKNLKNIRLEQNDLTGWDLSSQNLSNASFQNSVMTDVNLRGADLKNANLSWATTSEPPVTDSSTVYNQWTVFPAGFDPLAAGLTQVITPHGDLDASDSLDEADLDLLQMIIFEHSNRQSWMPKSRFDLDDNGVVDFDDEIVWVKDLRHTWFGDANLDGKFDSADLVQVFAAGEFEDDFNYVSRWSTGDWNSDGEFNTSDLVLAFQDGGYAQGPRPDVASVPEPHGAVVLLIGLCQAAFFRVSRCAE
ncbi:MAG: pentapeptide repeat-containing protein, partial [Planctomycetales bacterium]|nr:pentapeptide repeat-containing protein [Planctomycetales bacterium]